MAVAATTIVHVIQRKAREKENVGIYGSESKYFSDPCSNFTLLPYWVKWPLSFGR